MWRKSHALTVRVFSAAAVIHERYPVLASRMQRVAQAVPSTIAAGAGRPSGAPFAHALEHATGTARELDYLLTLAKDLGALEGREHARLEARTDEVIRMLVGLRSRVRGGSERPLARPPSRGGTM